jgi:Glycosidases
MQHGRAIHEEARLPMVWGEGQDLNLLAFYRDLISLRKAHSCLGSGSRTTIYASDQVLAYRRKDSQGSLVTVLNISEQEVSLELELTESTLAFATSPECKVQSAGRKPITLPPFGGLVLE